MREIEIEQQKAQLKIIRKDINMSYRIRWKREGLRGKGKEGSRGNLVWCHTKKHEGEKGFFKKNQHPER